MKATVGQAVTYIAGDESEAQGVVTESNNSGATIELAGKVTVRDACCTSRSLPTRTPA